MIDSNKGRNVAPIKVQIRRTLEHPRVQVALDLINCIFVIILVIVYIYSTGNAEKFRDGYMNSYDYFAFLIHCYFLIDYLLRMYIASDFVAFLLSMSSILDIITTFPYIIVTAYYGITNNDYYTEEIVLVRMLDVWRLYSLFKIMKFFEEDNIILSILSLVIISTALIQYIDNIDDFYNPFLSFNDIFFFVMTTVGVIGYNNDMRYTGTRIVVVFCLIWALAVVPSKAGEIVNLISKRSAYADYKYKIISKVPHIVLIGSISLKNAVNFFDEYFHEDHGNNTRHCIIIKGTRPDKKMESLLETPKYLSKVHYIEGNPHDKKTFNRAKLDKATNVVILSNNLTSDPSKEDANTILQAMVIKKYLKTHENSHCKVRLQLLKPESIMHYELSLNKETKDDQIVCIENLKLSLLAKSCSTPGLISLVSNLIKS